MESEQEKTQRERERMREEDEKRNKDFQVSLLRATGLSLREAEEEYERMKVLPRDGDGYLIDEEDCGCEGSCPVCRIGEVTKHKCNSCGVEFCPECHGIKNNVQSENVLPCQCKSN